MMRLTATSTNSVRKNSPQPIDGHNRVIAQDVVAGFGKATILKGISLNIPDKALTAIMGPSGCGKSTFIRCINRLHEEIPRAWISGKIVLDDEDIYEHGTDPVAVRRKIGMVFQRPNPFPTFSIYDNVAVGPRLNGMRRRAELDAIVEQSLRNAAIWEEVKDRLNLPGTGLSGRPAAAALHRPRSGGEPRDTSARRALFGP